MLTAFLVTVFASPAVALAAWWVRRALLAAANSGRHSLATASTPYRPNPPAVAPVDLTLTTEYQQARREAWARAKVADAGKSWTTHMTKFSGAVVPRPVDPDQWFGVPNDVTRKLEVTP